MAIADLKGLDPMYNKKKVKGMERLRRVVHISKREDILVESAQWNKFWARLNKEWPGKVRGALGGLAGGFTKQDDRMWLERTVPETEIEKVLADLGFDMKLVAKNKDGGKDYSYRKGKAKATTAKRGGRHMLRITISNR